MRNIRIALIAVSTFLCACGSDSTTNPASASLAGTYTLRTINGQALPFVSQNGTAKATVLSDVLTVADGGTWSETSTFSVQGGATQVGNEGGTWARAGTNVSFTRSVDGVTVYAGTFDGTTLRVSDIAFSYVFSR